MLHPPNWCKRVSNWGTHQDGDGLKWCHSRSLHATILDILPYHFGQSTSLEGCNLDICLSLNRNFVSLQPSHKMLLMLRTCVLRWRCDHLSKKSTCLDTSPLSDCGAPTNDAVDDDWVALVMNINERCYKVTNWRVARVFPRQKKKNRIYFSRPSQRKCFFSQGRGKRSKHSELTI